MNPQYKNFLVKSFVKGIRDQFERPSYHSLSKKSTSIEPHKRRPGVSETIQVKHQFGRSEQLILPTFTTQKRKSFIDVYNESIIKRSEQKKSRESEIDKSNQYMRYKIMMRKRLLNKSKFRVEGLPTIFKDKKDAIQMWNDRRNKQGCRTCADDVTMTLEYGGDQQHRHKKTEKMKRSVTDENFIMEPWEEMDSYYQ